MILNSIYTNDFIFDAFYEGLRLNYNYDKKDIAFFLQNFDKNYIFNAALQDYKKRLNRLT